jgi:hypothetical protein
MRCTGPRCDSPALRRDDRLYGYASRMGVSDQLTRSFEVSDLPILRALPELGPSWDDPSEDLLFELLMDIERGEGTFLIVERLADASGHTYVQTARNSDGSYVVQHREGHADRHYGAVVPDMRAAHKLLTGWAFELSGWSDGIAWERVRLPS